MKTFVQSALSVLIIGAFAFVTPVLAAAPNWALTAPEGITFMCGGSPYTHTLNAVTNDEGGTFSGEGMYDANNAYTWDVDGVISGDDITFTIVYTGLNSGYTLHGVGTIANDGSISGSVDGNCETFSMSADAASYLRSAEITSPDAGAQVSDTVTVSAYLNDNDADSVQWAIRAGTCAAGVGTVFGNVDGHTDVATIDQSDLSNQTFSFDADMSSLPLGLYCFIYNPVEDAGETNIRLTREFELVAPVLGGGGHILEQDGAKRKNWKDVSFGTDIIETAGGYEGHLDVVFHNTSVSDVTKTSFHGTNIVALNLFITDSLSCDEAMNMTVEGMWNNMPGYTVVLRAGDLDAPSSTNPDTIRITLVAPDNSVVYDTHGGDFADESSCVGTARTTLDNGNITIY